MIQGVVHKAEIVTDAEAERLVVTTSRRNVRRLQTMAGRRTNNPKAERLFMRELTRQLNTKK